MLRYSDRPIFKFLENSPNCTVQQSAQDIAAPVLTKVKESLSNLLEGLKRSASAGNSSYKFSSGEQEISEQLSVYALAQCNPYLSASECSNCLGRVMNNLQQCCSTLNGAGSYGPICSVAFGNYPLLDVVTNATQQPILPQPTGHSGRNGVEAGTNRGHAIKIAIIVLGVVSFMLFGFLVLVLSKRKRKKSAKQDKINGQVKLEDTLQLDFSSIQFATDNFSDAKRLGNGTSGAMYKRVLPDGMEIAVKILHKSGRDDDMEFDNEVMSSANLQHKNLVKLLGFCIEKDQRVLVYEYLPNGNLHDILNDPVKRASLDWQTRYHIISGLTRGLLYLHEDSQVRVIYRDLKPSNILLGDQMDSKISNFRTASLNRADQTRPDTREVVGTYGYMPTEYVRDGYFSIKSDIFSYGVMVLEIITGHLINGFSNGEKEESLLTCVSLFFKWSTFIFIQR
ncbi:hypothetical protein KSS87_003657 [Heliosperma pusillum]|nr:hypothetical protein KSS87_003657 [Heliosperma pusillum]